MYIDYRRWAKKKVHCLSQRLWVLYMMTVTQKGDPHTVSNCFYLSKTDVAPSYTLSYTLLKKSSFLGHCVHYTVDLIKNTGTLGKMKYVHKKFTTLCSYKKYILSNSESVQCNFLIFDNVTFILFKICCCIQNFIKIGCFFTNRMIFRWDMAIYWFSKWRPSAILELFYHHTRPPMKYLLLAAAACQISCQCDTQIWRYSYLNFSQFGLRCLFRTLDP